VGAPAAGSPRSGPAWEGIDHVVLAVPGEHLDQEAAFFRTLFGLAPGKVEEFIEPHGRLRSRALRPAEGDLRLVLNVEEGRAARPVRGLTQVAVRCSDVAAAVGVLHAAGVPLMAVPDNYYVDLGARFGLSRRELDTLREHRLLYDRDGSGGELRHAFTADLGLGFHLELLERRGGYDGFGAANTHVRLAAQATRLSPGAPAGR